MLTNRLFPTRDHRIRLAVATGLNAVLLIGLAIPASSAEVAVGVPIRPELVAQLDDAEPRDHLLVLVTGASTRRAVAAVRSAGLSLVEVFDRLSIVVAVGTPAAIRAVHKEPEVLRVDANAQLEELDDIAHRATGVAQLRDSTAYPELRRLRRRSKSPYDGTGVSIAVVDSNFDPLHEQFVADGKSKFDVHLRQACPLGRWEAHYATGTDPLPNCGVWVSAPPGDGSLLGSGHGTITAGVAAGYPRTTNSGMKVSGGAPGARLVGLSTGTTVGYTYNAVSALNWVLEHHRDPCGNGACPPIRVVNNSYGLAADTGPVSRRFDPASPMSRVTTELIEDGVVVVFAAGNDRGDGTTNKTSIFALHPLPGMLGVGAYHDFAGDPDAGVAGFSSRGKKGEPETYPDIVAPGDDYLIGCSPMSFHCSSSLQKDGEAYAYFDGTSIAAPYVSGVIATLLEAEPSLTPMEIEDLLEDSAYQGFIDDELLEPDRYKDPAGSIRGNDDHSTTFHAGHGLVDAVGALSAILTGKKRFAPNPCERLQEVTIADPLGDTTLTSFAPQGGAGADIVEVAASLLTTPDALTVVVRYADLKEREAYLRTTLELFIDGDYAEVDLVRTFQGDTVSVFRGDVQVEGSVDQGNDTATFVLRPSGGPIRERANVWAYTARQPLLSAKEADYTAGACSIWQRSERGGKGLT